MAGRPGKALSRAGALLPAVLLASCAVGPDFVAPASPGVEGFTPQRPAATTSAPVAGGNAQGFASGSDVSAYWWTLFRSKQLSAFVGEAVRNHPDVKAAELALRNARENVLAQQGSLFPQLTANGSAERDRASTSESGQWPAQASTYTLYGASVSVSYALDLWGGTRRQVEALQAQSEYQAFKLEATYLTLTANVVTAAITDASLRDQISATEEIIKAEADQLARIQHQFDIGAISKSDVLSQEATLAQAKATLAPLQKQLAQQRDQLMAYLGRLPSQDRGEHVRLVDLRLPGRLPLSLPSALVRQRPDIRQAEATLHQATATVGVGIANLLPQLTLSASYGASGPERLFSPDTIVWSAASSVSQKIFDGGTLYHTKEADVAAFEQNLALYKSAVVTAFQNVADSLRAVQYDAATLKAQAAAEKATADSLAMAVEQFKTGAVPYANIINAQQSYLNARVSRIKAQATRFTDTAALFQSLGGGWWNRTDETPDALPRVDPGYFAGSDKKTQDAMR
ncbi:efflux transporter outer membrane subunit [Bradyrhizobium guangdongense]|uniref:Histidine kinase n=1 Tax=Bradyrhizobium guangdongense TaxID=1325090 RepID=A0ABX6UR50_9BRAD|nr:efflux transporter outer membrane subunit [Bradyrhizobium guangdongense]QAU42726.1 histidine kinase [Bradyrhizobium guangdongense]QOZ63781.1 histidine kinase [Bradyrhizobium guangdongense]